MTVANPVTNFGALLWMAPKGDALVAVAELTSLTPPQLARDTVNVTTHASAQDEFGGVPQEFMADGTYDPGEIGFTVHYDPGSGDDEALMEAFASGAMQTAKFAGKSADGVLRYSQGDAVLTQYQPQEQPVNGVKVAQCRLKRSGVWTRGIVA